MFESILSYSTLPSRNYISLLISFYYRILFTKKQHILLKFGNKIEHDSYNSWAKNLCLAWLFMLDIDCDFMIVLQIWKRKKN